MSARTSGGETARHGPGIFPILNRFLILLAVAVSIAGLVITFLPEVKRHRQEQSELRRLRMEIENHEQILGRAKQELDLLQTNPEYVEIIARDKMDLMKEGETIFRIEPGTAVPPPFLPGTEVAP